MVWHFQLQASNFQSQLSFLKLWNILCSIFFFFLSGRIFHRPHFFRNLAKGQVLDSGNNKTWKNFLKAIFLYFVSPHEIESFFIHFFSLLHSQNSCSASSIWNTWSPPLAPLFYFDKTHFYCFKKSTLPIFNVSRLGQLSDLFLLLFFPPLPLLKYWCHAVLVAVCCTFVIFFCHCSIFHYGFWARFKKKVKRFSIILTFFLLSHGVPPVPSGPPRKVEVEAVNSSSIKVIWRSPMPTKQHGQIRGYQVHYVRMVNGEPTGQPVIKDILIDDAQV